jgi:DUF971 family protein
MAEAAYPEQLVLHEATRQLELSFSDGVHAHLSARALRVACKCAGCENLRRAGQSPVAPDGIALAQLNPIGEFGLQLVFNDGHDRGIYPWAYLHELSTTGAQAA